MPMPIHPILLELAAAAAAIPVADGALLKLIEDILVKDMSMI